jgi:DnaA family protein
MRQLPLGVRLRERSVFASWVAGPNAAALSQVEAAAAGRPGAVWVCGPAGTGKTHLLQAAVAAAAEASGAGYLPLRQLAPLGPATVEGWSSSRCLAIDDLDAVVGERAWEEAVFNLYRNMEEQGGSLLLAAGAPPALLGFLLPDLASRCAAATIFQLRPLDEVAQREALRRRAQLRGLTLPEETAVYLQRRFPRDMNSLYALLDALDDAALVAQRRLTVPFIREVLARWPPA